MTRDEYYKRKAAEEQGMADAREAFNRAQVLSQASVHAGSLTGDEHWDLFLSYIQFMREAYEKEKERAVSHLMNPAIVDRDEIIRLKVMIARYSEAVTVLGAVIGVPKLLKDAGDKAAEVLEKMKDQGYRHGQKG